MTLLTSTFLSINPFQPCVAFHIETSHLFYRANQMTGFYMKRNKGLIWVKRSYFDGTNASKLMKKASLGWPVSDSTISFLKLVQAESNQD